MSKYQHHYYTVYYSVTSKLQSLLRGPQKEVGMYIFGVINVLPVDLEDQIFSLSIKDKDRRKTFSLKIKGYLHENKSIADIEIYPVESLLKDYNSGILKDIIYCIKFKQISDKQYRLFFFPDKNIRVIVYLHLTDRPWDDWNCYDWDKQVKSAYYHYINFEKPNKKNKNQQTGKWSWR